MAEDEPDTGATTDAERTGTCPTPSYAAPDPSVTTAPTANTLTSSLVPGHPSPAPLWATSSSASLFVLDEAGSHHNGSQACCEQMRRRHGGSSPASTRTHAAGYENDPSWGIIQSRDLSARAADGRERGIARGLTGGHRSPP